MYLDGNSLHLAVNVIKHTAILAKAHLQVGCCAVFTVVPGKVYSVALHGAVLYPRGEISYLTLHAYKWSFLCLQANNKQANYVLLLGEGNG